MMRYEIFAALTEYMRENVFRYSYLINGNNMVYSNFRGNSIST